MVNQEEIQKEIDRLAVIRNTEAKMFILGKYDNLMEPDRRKRLENHAMLVGKMEALQWVIEE